MSILIRYAAPVGVAMLFVSIAVLPFHPTAGKIISSAAFALLALHCHTKAGRHPPDSKVRRWYTGASVLLCIGIVSTVLSLPYPDALPRITPLVTLVAGSIAAHIARRLDYNQCDENRAGPQQGGNPS